jgi:hypothetical protein
MPANFKPIFPLTPYVKSLSLAAVSACTTRAPTATASLAAANILELTPVSTNGRRIDRIEVNAASSSITATTAAQLVGIWVWDGTTAYLVDEIPVTAQAPSTTAAAFTLSRDYTTLVLPAAFKLFASTTVATTASTTALVVTVFGGDY